MILRTKGEYYNTEKAQKIVSSNGATIYKAIRHGGKDTCFFLHHTGGDEEAIIPLTEDEAKRATRRMLPESEWEQVWADLEAGSVPCNITAKKSVVDEFRQLRQAKGMKSGEFLELLIDNYKMIKK